MTNCSPLFTLTVEQQLAVDLIMTGMSDREVGEKVGVSREIVTRWRNHHPAVIGEINRRRSELVANGMEQLRMLVPEAVTALRSVINDPKDPNRAKVAMEVVKMVRLPEDFPAAHGPRSAEEVVENKAAAKIDLYEQLSGKKPTEQDLQKVVKELTKELEM